MTSARLKHCLSILRWRDTDLADASGYAIGEVRTWLDGSPASAACRGGMARGTGQGLQRRAPPAQRA